PGQVSFFATKAPVFFAMGVPVEVLGLMLAVEVIPDTFMTVGNVTGHVAATAVVARDVQPASVTPPVSEEAARPSVD
ncbi:MAG: dicarboxylate/amino acid:cation symporter, partial [Acidobacteria bacterium]|nr:dicarboxylate/amino acid:cation symporter [Acidobacteriota bacterium]